MHHQNKREKANSTSPGTALQPRIQKTAQAHRQTGQVPKETGTAHDHQKSQTLGNGTERNRPPILEFDI